MRKKKHEILVKPQEPKSCTPTSEIISCGYISPCTDITIINQLPGCNNQSKVCFSARIAGTNAEQGLNVAVDSCDNIIVIGFFNTDSAGSDNAVVYNADGCPCKSLPSTDTAYLFIVKYDPHGFCVWSARIGTVSSDYGYGLAVDSCDNIIITGSYNASANVYDSSDDLVTVLPLSGSVNSFIVKYDTCGGFVWSSIMTSDNTIESIAVTIDKENRIYVTGFYQGNAQFYNSDLTTIGTTLPNSTSEDTFIASYSPDGSAEWAARVSGANSERGLSIDTDSFNNVVVTGFYISSLVTLYHGPNGTASSGLTLTNADPAALTADAFVVKYTNTGNAIWATRISGINTEHGNSLTIDNCDNIVITGEYTSQTVTIFDTPNGSIDSGLFLTNSGSSDTFIVKYGPDGTAIWATRIAGANQEQGNSVATDGCNNIVVTGQYLSNPLTIYNFDGSSGPTLSSTNHTNAFIAKYNEFGQSIWASKLSGTGTSSGLGVAFDHMNNVVVTGFYNSDSLQIYNSDGCVETTLINNGNTDAFIVKYFNYLQKLELTAPLCLTKNKTICFNSYNGTNTLIKAAPCLLQDNTGRKIREMILTDKCSCVNLLWCNNIWTITTAKYIAIL